MYVREPHPGEHCGPHQTFDQKLQLARTCQAQDDIRTPVVVDDLAGTMHRAYGLLPNMVYVIDRQGRVIYRAVWTDHDDVAAVLANVAWAEDQRAQGLRVKASYVERIAYVSGQYAPGLRERVFDRAGPQASRDYDSVLHPKQPLPS